MSDWGDFEHYQKKIKGLINKNKGDSFFIENAIYDVKWMLDWLKCFYVDRTFDPINVKKTKREG